MRYKIDKLVQLIMDYRGKTPKKLGMNWTENQCDIVALSAKNIKDNKIVNTDKSHYGSESLYKRWMKDGDIEPGDILITSEAPLGEVYLITKPIKAILSQRLFLLRFNKNIVNPWYIFAFMNSQSFKNKLFSKATGTTVVGIKQKELRKIEIDLPNIRLQNKVGDIFRVIYKKIIINEIINDNLLELAKALFHEKFSYDDEVLLSNYFLPKRGKNLLKRNVVNGYIPVVAGGLTPAAFHNESNTESPVITISSSGANAGYTQIWGQKVWSSDSSYIDKTVTDNIYFWYLIIKSHQKQIFDSQTGSAQPHIYPQDIGNILIPKINEAVAKKIDKAVTPIFQKIFQNKDENKTLDNIKAVLLDRYFH